MPLLFTSATLTCLLLAAAPATSPPVRRAKPVAAAPAKPPAAPSALAANLDAITREHRGLWGVHVQNIATGQTLYEHCANCFFVPASNTKLFSTAFALSRLGPSHRFRTVVGADQPPDADGTLRGSLRVIGSGDPTFSRRAFPYSKHAPILPSITALEDLADQIVASGFRRVEGDLIGDDTAWTWEPSPDGWSHDDFTWDYGAPVSALSLNDNVINILVRPAATPGLPARITFTPSLEYFTVDNRLETVSAGIRDMRIVRMTGSRQILLTGRMPVNSPWQADIAVDDPALYFAEALKQALEKRGVSFSGVAATRHRSPGNYVLPQPPAHMIAQRLSPPVADILTVVNKVSQNQIAEIMMRAAGGVEAMRQWLSSIGISRSEFRFEDASGLSRLTLATPRATTHLLARMANNNDYLATLPVGGLDGSLARRFAGVASPTRVKAKTGGMTGVNTLSGYIDSPTHGRLAFSIMVNNDPNLYSTTSAYIDRIIAALNQ